MIIENNIIRKRGNILMKSENNNENNNHIKIKNIFKKIFTGAFAIGISCSLIANFMTDPINKVLNNLKAFASLPTTVNNLQSSIDSKFEEQDKKIASQLERIETLENLSKNSENEHSNSGNSNNANITINLNSGLRVTEEWNQRFSKLNAESNYMLSNPLWEKDDIIAESIITGKKYTAEQLWNKKVLLPYKYYDKENGHIVENYFYGQFNENNHWHGNCIVNVYSKNILVAVLEAKYDDGKLLSYKQIMQDNDKDFAVGIWRLSKRTSHANYDSGKTFVYPYTEIKQKFKFANVTKNNVLKVDTLQKEIEITSWLAKYYEGNTSNGTYNDNTGNAYYVKYSENGEVEKLYNGNFKNGHSEDDTGNAQEIGFDIYKNKYYYYQGNYREGFPTVEINDSDYVTQKQIDKIVRNMNINCEIKWHET